MVAKAFSMYIKFSLWVIAVSIAVGIVVGLVDVTNGAILVTIPFLAIGYFLGKRKR